MTSSTPSGPQDGLHRRGTLKASTFDDLVEQLDQIKTLAVGGAMDDALAACANAVKSNFKAAKDKKASRS